MIGAVTITGVLSSRSPNFEYFTTAIYPFVFDDTLVVANPGVTSGVIWENPEDDSVILLPIIVSGTLEDTIVYREYNNGVIEDSVIPLPAIVSGTLEDTIVYKEYNNGVIEDAIITLPTIVSGTFETTIGYVEYDNGVIEDAVIPLPTILSGTLI